MTLLDLAIHKRILTKKQRLDTYRPLSNQALKKLHETMEITYTYNTNAIEGNTLTLQETRLVIREGITIKGKSLSEHLEAKNHPQAITYIENMINNPMRKRTSLNCIAYYFLASVKAQATTETAKSTLKAATTCHRQHSKSPN